MRWPSGTVGYNCPVPLDPQIADVLAATERLRLPELWEQPLAASRAGFRQQAALRNGGAPPLEVGSVLDDTVAGVPVRVYIPRTVTVDSTVAYFHGGGWVIGDLDTHDPIARLLCDRLGARVVSVDYPLAPEHPYPEPLDACTDVVEALAERGPVAVAGDSAGGNLATAVCLRTPAVTAQLLLYPCLDVTMSRPSYEENAEGYGLTASSMAWFWAQYAVSDADQLASPLAAADVTAAPPAVVATAGYDVLRDEGDDYAEQLAAAGVPVTHLRYPTLNHSFFAVAALVPAAAAAVDEVCAAFRARLESHRP